MRIDLRRLTALWLIAGVVVLVVVVAQPNRAAALTDAEVMQQVAFAPLPGSRAPDGLQFHDGAEQHSLASLLARAPSLLTFAWFDCGNLCGLTLNSLADSSGRLDGAGEYQVVVVSMDAGSTPMQARHQQRDLQQRYPIADIDKRWRFLTGSQHDIHTLAKALGFHFVYDERKAQFAHPAGIIALDREGRVRASRSGLHHRPEQLRQLLAAAGTGTATGAVTEAATETATQTTAQLSRAHPLLILCYDYDPVSGRYSLAIMKLLRGAALLCLLLLGATLWYWQRRAGAERE